jgi:cysteamine dioxygenase
MSTLEALIATCARAIRGRTSSVSSSSSSSSPLCGRDPASVKALRDVVKAVERVALVDFPVELRRYAAGDDGDSDAAGHRRPRPRVRFLRVHAEEDFSVGAFVMDAGACIPLHDHPGMSVVMRCLFGACRVVGYDFEDDDDRLRLLRGGHGKTTVGASYGVRLACDKVLKASPPAHVLHPDSGGNVHSLHALSNCALFEVQTPPYAVGRGRDCHYFEICDGDGDGDGDDDPVVRRRVLRETPTPADFVVSPFLSN